MSGTPVFVGTQVPLRALLDHLETGDSLDVFLSHGVANAYLCE